MTDEELLQTLTNYEGALQRVADEGDDAAITELDVARTALLDLLKEARRRPALHDWSR